MLQGPPLGQRAGQTHQAEDWELLPEGSGPLSGDQGGAGPHHRLLSLQAGNRSGGFPLLLVGLFVPYPEG